MCLKFGVPAKGFGRKSARASAFFGEIRIIEKETKI